MQVTGTTHLQHSNSKAYPQDKPCTRRLLRCPSAAVAGCENMCVPLAGVRPGRKLASGRPLSVPFMWSCAGVFIT